MGRPLGQHFLRPAAVERLLRAILPRPDEDFLEIGPGAGALTLPLAGRARRVVAVELDARLADDLERRAPANVRIHRGDALAVDLAGLLPAGGRVVGNLPYYVSSPLLRRLLDLHGRARDLHVMVQDEVARRVASPPGSKEYGILSVLYALWADVTIPLRFGPGSFRPPPRVSSAVLRVRFLPHPRAEVEDPAGFERLLQAAFARRRRTLENNLREAAPGLARRLPELGIDGARRAETLSVVEFARLAAAEGGA
ncbi:MAG: ribosomal RNA small subunit methyltransferase A [Acidobacteria bacterium]|nr:ribosomal RNA small subunit methyltransferase A [Acidobacteriota bacterium]